MRPNAKLARRYAVALGEVAVAQGVLNTVEAELGQVVKLASEHEMFSRLLTHSQLSVARKLAVTRQVVPLSPVTERFLELVLTKRREGYLQQMLDEFREFADRARGVVRVQVRTAVGLESEVLEGLRKKLAEVTGNQVQVEEVQDPSLIGGVAVRVGDTVIDGTVLGRLGHLRQRLHGTEIRVG